MIVLNHYAGFPVLFKPHIKYSSNKERLKAEFDDLEGVKWLLEDNEKDKFANWERESR